MNVALFHMFMTFMTFMTFIRRTLAFWFSPVCQRAKPAKRDGPTSLPQQPQKRRLLGTPFTSLRLQKKPLISLVNMDFVPDASIKFSPLFCNELRVQGVRFHRRG